MTHASGKTRATEVSFGLFVWPNPHLQSLDPGFEFAVSRAGSISRLPTWPKRSATYIHNTTSCNLDFVSCKQLKWLAVAFKRNALGNRCNDYRPSCSRIFAVSLHQRRDGVFGLPAAPLEIKSGGGDDR